jgi:hypothetical protein
MTRLCRFGWLPRSLALGALVTSLLTLGCGTGEYNSRLEGTVRNVGRRAAIEAYLGPGSSEAAPGTAVQLRLPTLFDGSAKSVAPAEPRAKIGAASIPDLVRVMERAIDDPAGKFSVCYVYFAAAQKEGKPQDVLQNELQRAIAAALPNAKWETAQLEKLSGGTASFPVLKASGPQPFDATQNGGANEQHEGQFELYLVPADKHWVLIGWRAPTAHASKYQFWDAVRASMATVEVGGGSAPAAPAAAPAGDPMAPGAAPAEAAANNPPGHSGPPGAVGGAVGLAPLNP